MLNRAEIERHIESIATGLDHLAKDSADLNGYIEIQEHFAFLREQYRRFPEDFRWAVDRLAQLRRKFDESVDSRLAQVVDRFHETNERLHQAEKDKAALRELLIGAASRLHVERLDGGIASAHIRTQETRQLPPIGSDLREQLESAIRATGCWNQVSQLSRPRLEKLLASRQLSPSQSEELDKLCPITITHQVTTRLQ